MRASRFLYLNNGRCNFMKITEEQTIKIFTSLNDIHEHINIRRTGRRVVYCHGVFDLLHIGHIKHLYQAKNFGDILVVGITADRYVNKGPGRPAFTEQLRAEALAALECVDYVLINNSETATDVIKKIRPEVYVKGDEYQDSSADITNKITEERDAILEVGGVIEYTHDITFSSSTLINKFFSTYSDEIKEFLGSFRRKYNIQEIFNYFERASDLKVLVVGESVIDTYCFTDVIGKAGKEPTLVGKHIKTEDYLGGSLALANHLSDFCKNITCLTYLGEDGKYEDLIREKLSENVSLLPIYKKDSPTIVKRRYLENYLRQKLFEVYEINDDLLDETQEQTFLKYLHDEMEKHDYVIVLDYAHGLLTEKSIELLMSSNKFIAVNTQSNAGNMGFNCITKYNRANYVAIANRELQLNYRQRHLPVKDQLQRLMQEYEYENVLITCGKYGANAQYQNGDQAQVPAFIDHVVDRVGAGDAVLALTSLFSYLDAPAELLAFVGNVVGSEAVNIMGNKDSIKKVSLKKHISHLLK